MLQGEHSAILLTFIKLPFVNKIFVLSIFVWLFYTGFTVSQMFVFFHYVISYYMYYGRCPEISNIFLFLFSNNMFIIRAKIHKMLVKIPNREDPDQTDLGLCCLSRPLWQATSIQNFRTFTTPLLSLFSTKGIQKNSL